MTHTPTPSSTHDWPGVAASLSQAMKPLRGGAPEAMTAFSALAKAALEPHALSTKTKEVMAASPFMQRRPCGRGPPARRSWRPWAWRSTWAQAPA